MKRGIINAHKDRADLFLTEIQEGLAVYRKKWIKMFQLKGWTWDEDLLYDTILKCYDTIDRLGLRDGKNESFNYLFKALKTNYIRELEYVRNRDRVIVDDIEVLADTYEMELSDVKIAKDLWLEFQFDYMLKEIEMVFDKKSFYLFKLKWVLQLDDKEILAKTKNPNWKKDLKDMMKYLKTYVKVEDIKKEFNLKYPEL